MEATGAEPDAVAVPQQQLHTGATPAGKQEGFPFPGRMPRGLSGFTGQRVDTGAHIGRLANQPEMVWSQHRLSSRMRGISAAAVPVTLALRRLSVTVSVSTGIARVTGSNGNAFFPEAQRWPPPQRRCPCRGYRRFWHGYREGGRSLLWSYRCPASRDNGGAAARRSYIFCSLKLSVWI